MSSRDLSAVVKTQKAFIKELLDRLEKNNYHIVRNDECVSVNYILEKLNDPYFANLSICGIFELAKKSIRLTTDNCEMQHKLADIMGILDNSELSDKIKDIIDK